MNLTAKIFVVIAILAGIWCGSNAKDRSRWLAALGMSKRTATELRIENTRDKFHSDHAVEQARWRADDRAAPAEVVPAALNVETVCAGVAEKEQLLHAQGKEIEAAARRVKAACSGEAGHMRY